MWPISAYTNDLVVMVTRRQDLVESDGLVFVIGRASLVHDHVPWMLRLTTSVLMLVVSFDPPRRLLVHGDDGFARSTPDGFFDDGGYEPVRRASSHLSTSSGVPEFVCELVRLETQFHGLFVRVPDAMCDLTFVENSSSARWGDVFGEIKGDDIVLVFVRRADLDFHAPERQGRAAELYGRRSVRMRSFHLFFHHDGESFGEFRDRRADVPRAGR